MEKIEWIKIQVLKEEVTEARKRNDVRIPDEKMIEGLINNKLHEAGFDPTKLFPPDASGWYTGPSDFDIDPYTLNAVVTAYIPVNWHGTYAEIMGNNGQRALQGFKRGSVE